MAYGLEIKNDSGSILIDGVSPNYSLLGEGVATAGVPVTFANSVNFSRVLVFVRFNTSNYFVRVGSIASNSVTFQIWNNPAQDVDPVQVGGTVEYRIYGIAASLPPTTGYGLQLYDASSVLVFDSNRKFPRIRQVVTIPPVGLFTDFFRHPNSVVGHSQGSSPWMLANFTRAVYGYNFIQETPQMTSDLISLGIRSDTTIGNRIIVQGVKVSQIGATGTSWSYAPIQVALMQ